MANTLSPAMIALIKDLADNKINDAKRDAITVCNLDDSKKNASDVKRLKLMLENRTAEFLDVPFNLKGILEVRDMSDFKADRYYLNEEREQLFQTIQTSVNVSEKMIELGIPYLNSTLLSGVPGTGKTEFAKVTAHRLGLPFAYINFSRLIDSYMGKTAQNLQTIFDYVKGERCVFLLDELDCIGLRRGNGSGADGELARTTIALMQCLDNLIDGQIVIAATNRGDRLDSALLRRFQRVVEFEPYSFEESKEMAVRYLNSIGLPYDKESIAKFFNGSWSAPQADVIKYINNAIVRAVSKNTTITL